MRAGWADPFDLGDVLRTGKQGEMARWVDAHLREPGGNVALADGLLLAPRLWEGLRLVPLGELERCCGPEVGMEYRVSAADWEARVTALASDLRAGGRCAPLIVQRRGGRLSVRDGNHRLAALHSLGLPAAWVLIWSDAPLP